MGNPVQYLVKGDGRQQSGPFTKKMADRVVEDWTEQGVKNITVTEYPYTSMQPAADVMPPLTFIGVPAEMKIEETKSA
jgi:hypothetical protein